MKAFLKQNIKFLLPAVLVIFLVILVVVLSVTGRHKQASEYTVETSSYLAEGDTTENKTAEAVTEETTAEETTTEMRATEPPATEETTTEIATTEVPSTEAATTEVTTTEAVTTEVVTTVYQAPDKEKTGQYLIAIDAGHQAQGNSEKEPIGPGASETKAKVASGTRGVSTGIPEYQLTLAVALKLKAILEQRGYQVLMIRETNDVNISNAERAEMANNAGADAFIRIHADGLDNSSVYGMSALCQSAANPYNGALAAESYRLSECVLNSMAAQTGAKNRGVKENDTMSGINWAQIPVTIIEMGFMTNPEEDVLMSTEEYQNKLATGMADGIDAYFFR